jgi:hypothetical protein
MREQSHDRAYLPRFGSTALTGRRAAVLLHSRFLDSARFTMASDQPRRPTQTWRQKTGLDQRTEAAKRAWQKEPAGPTKPLIGWTWKTKFGLGILGLLGFIGILIAVALWLIPVKPPTLILLGAGYQKNLGVPHNVHGWNGLKDLYEWAKSDTASSYWGGSLPDALHEPRELTRDSDWDQEMHQGRFKEATVVLFLALHGGADLSGPFLLPGDAEPPDSDKNRLRLERILDSLGKLDSKKNKVLILDATQVTANWPFGMLHNDFVRALKELDAKIKAIPNLVVISSSDIDQRSWTIDTRAYHHTIFAHYLIEGLKGAADKDHNKNINALQLYDYVRERVATWVRDTRSAEQVPLLLPEGEEGKQRAGKIHLTQVPNSYQELPAPEPPADFANEIQDQWEKYQRLAGRVPSPMVYRPHLWRQYEALVLRHEQVLRAGDTTSAAQLRDMMTDLASKLQAADSTPDSLANSLVMPSVFGDSLSTAQAEELTRSLEALWNEPDGNVRDKKWNDLVKGRAAAARLIALRGAALVVNQVARAPTEANRKKGVEYLQLMYPAGSLRPIEAHYLAMLQRDLPAKRPAESYLEMALKTRVNAEQAALAAQPGTGAAHCYSGKVFPWVKDLVLEADKQRRLGEDLLFATDEASWKRAEEQYLKKAFQLYEDAQALAGKVRQALATRDLVLAALPAYSQRLAARHGADAAGQRQDLENLEKLWNTVHQLDQLLERPDPQGARALESLSANVGADFKTLEEDFQKVCDRLGQSPNLPESWHEIEDALLVPRIDVETRRHLLDKSRDIAHELNAEFGKRGSAGKAPIRSPADARLTAERQGRMALAALGEHWLSEVKDIQASIVRDYVRNADPDGWAHRIRTAGSQIGLAWQALPKRIVELVKNGQNAAANWKSSVGDSTEAERLCRQIDGGQAADLIRALDAEDLPNPVLEHERLALHQLLVALAQRTFDDHWFGEQQDPYYQRAGKNFLSDAATAVKRNKGGAGGKPERRYLPEFETMTSLLLKPVRLNLTGTPHRFVTSETHYELQYRLTPDANLPAGYPVIAIELGGQLKLSTEDVLRRQAREAQSIIGDKDQAVEIPLVYHLERTEPDDSSQRIYKTKFLVRGYYRGQILGADSQVDLYFQPDIVATQLPVGEDTGLAVRAAKEIENKFSKGAIAIVLDCSGSMWYPLDPESKKDRHNTAEYFKRRFNKAVDALEQVLNGMDEGVIVSLWIFSNTLDAKKFLEEGEVTKDKIGGISRLRKPEEWKKDQIDTLMTRVRALIPYGDTPLVEAIAEAKNLDSKDYPKGFDGFKSIVVLTDGMDSEFKKQPKLWARHNTKDISQWLEKEFENSGFQINLVMFNDNPAEAVQRVQARANFKEVIEDKLTPPGRFFDTGDATDLLNFLKEVLHPQRCKIYENGTKLVGAREGLRVSGLTDNSDLTWSPRLRPYEHRIEVHKRLQKDVVLDQGDLLLLNVVPQGRIAVFERALYGKEPGVAKETRSQGDWLLAMLQDEREKKTDPAVQLVVTLENQSERYVRGDVLRQIRPSFVWFEVSGQLGDSRPIFHWRNLEQYPAPAWLLEMKDWPLEAGGRPVAPVLSAYWLENQSPRSLDALIHKANDPIDPNAKEWKRKLEASGYEVLNVSFETDYEGIKGPSMVVQLKYAKGKPVVAQLDGELLSKTRKDSIRPRHLCYLDADQYTAIFPGVTSGLAVEKNFSLNVISVNEFKKLAEEGKTAIVNWKLQSPNDQFTRPDPVPPLKPPSNE